MCLSRFPSFSFPLSLSPSVCVCVCGARAKYSHLHWFSIWSGPDILSKYMHPFLFRWRDDWWELAKVFYFQTYAMSAVESFHTVARILLFHGQMGQTGGRIRTRWTKQGYLKQTDKLSLWDSLELHRHLEGLSNRLGGAIVLHVMDGVSWEYQHRLNANLYYDCNL